MALQVATFGRWYPMPPLWLEGRVWLEYVQLMRDPVFGGEGVPPGRGRPVMLIPGFIAGDRSLDTMRGWLKRNGYRPLRSGIDFNVQSSSELVERIAARIREQVPAGKKVIVIGQSRGGSLGLGLAQRYPRLVERVHRTRQPDRLADGHPPAHDARRPSCPRRPRRQARPLGRRR